MSELKSDDLPNTDSSSSASAPAEGEPAAAPKNAPSESAAAPAAETSSTPDAGATPAAAEAERSTASEPAATDDAEEIEPESMEPVRPKVTQHSHHPPPPPSLRFKSVMTDAGTAQLNEARFAISGTPRLARDLMTRKIFTIEPTDTLEHLEDHMQAFRFRHLPVVDGDKVVGLITHRDLLHASSSFLSERARERDEIIHKVPASRVMRTELVTARPDTPLAEIAALMWQKKIGCVLVTDEAGLLVGILTEADFIRLAHHFLVHATAPASSS